jgi:hypothetical protein
LVSDATSFTAPAVVCLAVFPAFLTVSELPLTAFAVSSFAVFEAFFVSRSASFADFVTAFSVLTSSV